MRNHLFIWFTALLLASCQTSVDRDSEGGDKEISTALPDEIAAKLAAQEQAWNEGDIDRFMAEAYWANDSLMFIGSRGLSLGYESTRTNYHRSYPDSKAMGALSFELLNWHSLGARHGILVGAWNLERDEDLEQLTGHFTLIWELQSNGWVIIADHSS